MNHQGNGCDVLDKFLQSVDVSQAMAHVSWLTQHARYRQTGGENEQKAIEYAADRLLSYGFDVTLHRFSGYAGSPGEGQLTVLTEPQFTAALSVFALSAETPKGGLEADLVFCGHGAEGDYAGVDVTGKVVLTTLSFTPSRPEKARLAAVHGAAGILMMNFLSGEFDNLPEGAVKSLWGNPTDRDVHALQQQALPSAGLRRADGERLRQRLEAGPVRVRLELEAQTGCPELILPCAFLPGRKEPDRFTLMGGHICSWSGGATDNGSGDGGILELARVCGLHREQFDRSIMVTLWPAHEQGIMGGSTWFVDTFWDKLDDDCLLYLNLDEMGKRGTSLMRVNCSPEAAALAQIAAEQAVGAKDIPVRDLVKMGDQSFFGIGIPSVWLGSGPDEATLKQWQGAEFGWWWHTRSDTMDKLDPVVYERELLANAGVLWRLSRGVVLPFRFGRLAVRIDARLETLAKAVGDYLDLGGVRELSRSFVALAARLDLASDQGKDTSDLQMRLSRILTSATSSVAGRWGQDSYGLSDLKSFLPGLRSAQTLDQETNGDMRTLVQTRLVRERNRLRDALKAACNMVAREL